MATLSDENTTDIGRHLERSISTLVRVMFRYLLKKIEQKSERNFKAIEKNSPERIKTADLNRGNIDKFKILAEQNGVKNYQIVRNKHKTPTLKYDVKDEHKITEIYKQIQSGYRIPENSLMAFMEKYTDTNQLINKVSNMVSYKSKEEISEELNNSDYYREENILNQDNGNPVQDIYDKNVKEVTGKENQNTLYSQPPTEKQLYLADKLGVVNYEDMNKVELSLALEKAGAEKSYFKKPEKEKQVNKEQNKNANKDELSERLDKLKAKEKSKENKKENKTKQKDKNKEKTRKAERER